MRTSLSRTVIVLAVVLATLGLQSPADASTGVTDQHPTAPLVDEVWLRSEANLGIPSQPDDGTPGEAGVFDGDPWLATRARQFVTVKKEAFFRGDSRTVNGIQMSSSFVSAAPSHVAVHFSAEALVETIGGKKPVARRMFVRALLDGAPAKPSDVVFAVGPTPGARAFVFTAEVGEGIHTVEIQWSVDAPRGDEKDVVGRMRSASLMVRQGAAAASPAGNSDSGAFEVQTPPSGANLTKSNNVWTPIPGMVDQVEVAAGGAPLTATFSAESRSTGKARMALRAVVDGVPMLPADVIFAKGGWQSRSATFSLTGLAPGLHTVQFEWLADGKGTIAVGDRSMALAGFANLAAQPSHAAVSLSGVQDTGTDAGPAPGMSVPVWIPERGNGEVAAIFSAEVGATGGPAAVGLAVDGQLYHDSVAELLVGEEAQVRSWVFDAKNLAPGLHEVAVWWLPAAGSKMIIGDRTLAAVAETGAIPDVAEAAHLGIGKYSEGDNVTGLEAVIGTRPVLTVQWDADRPAHPDDITGAELDLTLDRVADYYASVSGGRFEPVNAGVVGPYDALSDEGTSYWNHPVDGNGDPICQGGFSSGATHRRSEAVFLSDPDVDYSDYDRNNDGRVDPAELAIVVVYKENGEGFGQALQPLLNQQCPGADQPLVLDGVELPSAVDWFVERPSDTWTALAHELGHHQLGLADLYYGGTGPAHVADTRSLMGLLFDDATPHLDAVHKLALGWVTPQMVTEAGHRSMQDVKLAETVDILPRWNTIRRDEYFVIENRQSGLGWGQHDDGIGGSGILVWHVAEDGLDNVTPPIGTDSTLFAADGWSDHARRAVRLLRPWTQITEGAAVSSAAVAGWHVGRYPLLAGPCPVLPAIPGIVHDVDNTLTWADCTASPYSLRNWSALPAAPDPLDPPSTAMGFDVAID